MVLRCLHPPGHACALFAAEPAGSPATRPSRTRKSQGACAPRFAESVEESDASVELRRGLLNIMSLIGTCPVTRADGEPDHTGARILQFRPRHQCLLRCCAAGTNACSALCRIRSSTRPVVCTSAASIPISVVAVDAPSIQGGIRALPARSEPPIVLPRPTAREKPVATVLLQS